MARKKKIQEEYIHSPYQLAIFDYIQHEHGHLVIEASAGSGKTYTIIKALGLIPSDKKVLLTAFNKDIVNELKRKAKGYSNVSSFTMHGLGYLMLLRNLGNNIELDEFKYISYIRNCVRKLSVTYSSLSRKDAFEYVENVKKYVDFGRFYLCESEKDLDFIEERYDIDTKGDEKILAIEVMKWGKEHIETIDFTDMIWLPNVLNLSPIGFQYDFIMVDECQDMNKAERELLFKCFKMGTRMISVGDKNQMLYAFSGGDPMSFNELCSLPNTKKLPLSISYRCGKKIVKFAQKIVPSIEANEENIDGEVKMCTSIKDAKDGDMILCRNNAPLVTAYMELLGMGKKAFIRGKDIGAKLKTYVKSMCVDDINLHSYKDGLENRMYDDFIKEMYSIMDKYSINEHDALTHSTRLANKLDMIMTINSLCNGLKTTKELIDKIESIFGKNVGEEEGIALSTIHKAKGLEADNVYILCEDLMPSKTAIKDWEILQEQNLIYVAYTRAKKILGFIRDKEFENLNPYLEISMSLIKEKESVCEHLYGTTQNVKVTKENASIIANKAIELKRNNTVSKMRSKKIDISLEPKNERNGVEALINTRKKRRKINKRDTY